MSKRARPDIQTTVSVLCSRVKAPTESDWDKLVRLLKYLNATRDDVLTLSIDDLRVIKWWVDASFAVHPDFKSHTGGCMSMGRGCIISSSRKQKINTKSSTPTNSAVVLLLVLIFCFRDEEIIQPLPIDMHPPV